MNTNYIAFQDVIFRTPLIPFNQFTNHLEELSRSDEKFKQLFSNKVLQESIYLASPVLFESLQKFLEKGVRDKDEERIEFSLVRYLSRMSTRCTPFGLFAGCSSGTIGDETKIVLKESGAYRRITRLDMFFLCALINKLPSLSDSKKSFRYTSNSTLYQFGDKLRYIEYFYGGARRHYQIAKVDYSEYLEKVLQGAATGATYFELVNLLIQDEITAEEASEFIDELISTQILVNEFEPSVTGADLLQQTLKSVKVLEAGPESEKEEVLNLEKHLLEIEDLLKDINEQPLGETLEMYTPVISKIKETNVRFEPKYLFQTDMVKPVECASLSKNLVNDILDALGLLNKLTASPGESMLSKFRDSFRERYEDKEVPLMKALDVESGIGYGNNNGAGNLLIGNLPKPKPGGSMQNIPWDGLQVLLLEKYNEASRLGASVIELKDEDVAHLKARWDDLPLTISVMCQVLRDDENGREVYMNSAAGSSAANLLGRFCHTDENINRHVGNITTKEEELNPNVLFAEIVHLPEDRMGNILSRPVLRAYEIPFLAKSAVAKEYQIDLSDLMISVREGRIVLRSKRLNKEIVPRLSSAHNFNNNPLPVYQFLCQMQTQNLRGGVYFSWGQVFSNFPWLPRVKYKNVLISAARWIVKKEEFKNVKDLKDNKAVVDYISNWRQTLKMPRYVLQEDGDNALFIDLENALSIRTLISVVHKRPSFILKEFLFDPDNAVVTSKEGGFTNEFVLSFYKNEMAQKPMENLIKEN